MYHQTVSSDFSPCLAPFARLSFNTSRFHRLPELDANKAPYVKSVHRTPHMGDAMSDAAVFHGNVWEAPDCSEVVVRGCGQRDA